MLPSDRRMHGVEQSTDTCTATDSRAPAWPARFCCRPVPGQRTQTDHCTHALLACRGPQPLLPLQVGLRALAAGQFQASAALLAELNNVLANAFKNALQVSGQARVGQKGEERAAGGHRWPQPQGGKAGRHRCRRPGVGGGPEVSRDRVWRGGGVGGGPHGELGVRSQSPQVRNALQAGRKAGVGAKGEREERCTVGEAYDSSREGVAHMQEPRASWWGSG